MRPMPFIQTERGKYHYQEFRSSGLVVYLLHGLGVKCQTWEGIPDLLAKAGVHVHAFDMRGHGFSDKPDVGYSPEDHAKDIRACVKALGHPKVHLVGHSTGGRNALAFASMFPEEALSLTIIDQTLAAAPDNWKQHQEYYASFPASFPGEAELDKYLRKRFAGRERLQAFEKGKMTRAPDGTWTWGFNLKAVVETEKLGRIKDAFDLLAKVQCPALFIKGGDSDYVTMEECQRIKSLLPKGNLEVVAKAKHGVFRDNPEGFLKVLIPFLKSANPTL